MRGAEGRLAALLLLELGRAAIYSIGQHATRSCGGGFGGVRLCPRLPRHVVHRPGGTVRQAVKQARISTQISRTMYAEHADGPDAGMVVHDTGRGTAAWGAAPVRQPVSHLGVLRGSAVICVKRFLACFDARRTLPRETPARRVPARTICTE